MQCEMSYDCTEPVTHIGEKGYIYCAVHAGMRGGYEGVRKMRKWELRWISEGLTLPSYERGPEPKREA